MHNTVNHCFMDFINFNKDLPFSDRLQSPYYQLGFICSVQAVPEIVELEDWLSHLWLPKEKIQFDNETQATHYAQQILLIANEINELYSQAIPLTSLNSLQWLDQQQQLTQNGVDFAEGFLMAIEQFNEQWLRVSHNETTQNLLQTTILLLTKLIPEQESHSSLSSVFEQLPETAEILSILPQLMSQLAFVAAEHGSSETSL